MMDELFGVFILHSELEAVRVDQVFDLALSEVLLLPAGSHAPTRYQLHVVVRISCAISRRPESIRPRVKLCSIAPLTTMIVPLLLYELQAGQYHLFAPVGCKWTRRARCVLIGISRLDVKLDRKSEWINFLSARSVAFASID